MIKQYEVPSSCVYILTCSEDNGRKMKILFYVSSPYFFILSFARDHGSVLFFSTSVCYCQQKSVKVTKIFLNTLL